MRASRFYSIRLLPTGRLSFRGTVAFLISILYLLLGYDCVTHHHAYLLFGLLLCGLGAISFFKTLRWKLILQRLGILVFFLIIVTGDGNFISSTNLNFFGFLQGIWAGLFFVLYLFSLLLWGSLSCRLLGFRAVKTFLVPTRLELSIFLAVGLIVLYLASFFLSAIHAVNIFSLSCVLFAPFVVFPRVFRILVKRTSLIAMRYLRTLQKNPLILITLVTYLSFSMCGGLYDDALTYHLVLPKEILAHRGFAQVSSNLNTFHPPLVGLQYLFFCAFVGAQYCSLLNVIVLPFLLFLLVFIGISVFKIQSRIAIIVLILSEDILQHALHRSNTDLCLAYFLTVALVVFMRKLERGKIPNKFDLFLSGLFCGASFACKYTALPFVFSFISFFIVLRKRLSAVVKEFGLAAIGFSVVAAPVVLRNYFYTGNPLAPLYRNVFEFGVSLEEKLVRASLDTLLSPQLGVLNWIRRPFEMYTSGQFGFPPYDSAINPFYLIAIPLSVVLWPKRSAIGRIWCYCVLGLLLWMTLFPMTRYLFPIVMLLSLFSVRIAEWAIAHSRCYAIKIAPRWNTKAVSATFFSVLLCFSTADYALSARDRLLNSALAFFGQLKPKAIFDLSESTQAYQVSEFLKDKLDEKHKLFMIFDSQTFLTLPFSVGDSYFTHMGLLQSQIRQGIDPLDWLRVNGIAYLLYDESRISWLRYSQVYRDRPKVKQAQADLDRSIEVFNTEIRPRLKEIARFEQPYGIGRIIYQVPNN